jgi:hypothetical protein
MEEKPVKVAVYHGVIYTGTGSVTVGRAGKRIEVRRMYLVDEWPGKRPVSYPERVAARLYGDRFYGGMLVRHGGQQYVLGLRRVEVVKGRA